MRRRILLLLGCFEVLIALFLVGLAVLLPGQAEVDRGVARVTKVTDSSERQIRLMRTQVEELRAKDLTKLTGRLKEQTTLLSKGVRAQSVDFKTMEAMSHSFGALAKGLEQSAVMFEGTGWKKSAEGLGALADYLETNVIGSAAKAADAIEKANQGLETDSRRLATLLSKAPPDLKAAVEVYEGLAKFDAGLEKMARILQVERMNAIREGYGGLEEAIGGSITSVDKLKGYTYPTVKLNGFKPPEVEMKPFWGEGAQVADGLRKAKTGVQAVNKELETIQKDLPTLVESIEESRKSIGRTRDSLAGTVKHQKELELLLRVVPDQSAKLADELPKIGKAHVEMLRSTEKIREVVTSLRQSHKNLEEVTTQWPELAKSLRASARVMTHSKTQLDSILSKKDQYELAVNSSAELTQATNELLTASTDKFDARLGEQEHSLEQMERGLVEVNQGIPETASVISDILRVVKWLLILIAGLVGLHGGYLVTGGLEKRTSEQK